MRSMLASSLLLLIAMPVCAADSGSYVGNAYALDSHTLLFRETHYQFHQDGHSRSLVLYTCPDGKAFARKVIGGGTAQAPDFHFVDALGGYREGVRESNGKRVVYVKRGANKAKKTATLPAVDTPVIDAGFDAFAKAHWKRLLAGNAVKVDFLVPSRLKFYHFIAKRQHVTSKQVTFRLHIDSWFAFALPHIDITYDRASRILRSFQGPSNVRGADGKNVKVVIKFPAAARRDTIADATLKKVRHTPLDGRCTLR